MGERGEGRLIGSPIYHFHTKVMLKEPRVGGTWEWHQDFGYWYQVGCLAPDKMLSAILAWTIILLRTAACNF